MRLDCRRTRRQPTMTTTALIIAVLSLCHQWHFAGTEEQQQQLEQKNTAEKKIKEELNRIPPSIYKWIEENAHICTIVPANGETLVNFLSEEEGAKCALCPELGTRELPSMACAIEVSPNEIDVGIGCHPVPELCVLELKTLYAEFYTGGIIPAVGMPPGPPGPPGNKGRTHAAEEDIFQATGNLFTSDRSSSINSLMELTSEKTLELLETEEDEDKEEEGGKDEDDRRGRKKLKKKIEENFGGETAAETAAELSTAPMSMPTTQMPTMQMPTMQMPTTTVPMTTTTVPMTTTPVPTSTMPMPSTTEASSTTTTTVPATTTSSGETHPTTTFVRANVFARPSPQGFPINLTMEESRMLSRTSKPQKGALIPPQTDRKMSAGEKEKEEEDEFPLEVKSPANTDPMPMKKRAKGRTGNNAIEDEMEKQDELMMAMETAGPCKDRHELCCFWAMSGECDSNPFWMRTKCPMTCGTCGCKVRNADKCRSVGVKCLLTTTTTTTTPSTTTTASTTTIPATTTTSPAPPPTAATTPSRRRPRPPTAPNQMPGHRPQRPRQRSRTSTTAATTETTTVAFEATSTNFDNNNRGGNAHHHNGEVPSMGMTNLVTVGEGADVNYADDDADYGGAEATMKMMPMPSFPGSKNAKKKTVSGHSGKRVPEGRIDAESRGPVTRQKWLLSASGPGYEETTADDSAASKSSPMNLSSTLPTSPAFLSTTSSKEEACFNYHKLCDFWAKMGECSNNPFWMRPHCQLACQSCGETLGDISTPPARSGCNNEHILCPFWAFIGECARNPRWMSLNCRASCELC